MQITPLLSITNRGSLCRYPLYLSNTSHPVFTQFQSTCTHSYNGCPTYTYLPPLIYVHTTCLTSDISYQIMLDRYMYICICVHIFRDVNVQSGDTYMDDINK